MCISIFHRNHGSLGGESSLHGPSRRSLTDTGNHSDVALPIFEGKKLNPNFKPFLFRIVQTANRFYICRMTVSGNEPLYQFYSASVEVFFWLSVLSTCYQRYEPTQTMNWYSIWLNFLINFNFESPLGSWRPRTFRSWFRRKTCRRNCARCRILSDLHRRRIGSLLLRLKGPCRKRGYRTYS